jgi:hypothetical protein
MKATYGKRVERERERERKGVREKLKRKGKEEEWLGKIVGPK